MYATVLRHADALANCSLIDALLANPDLPGVRLLLYTLADAFLAELTRFWRYQNEFGTATREQEQFVLLLEDFAEGLLAL